MTRNISRTLSIGALLLACGTALAAEWVRISAKGANPREDIDESSVRVEGDRRTAWVRYTFSPHSTKSNDGSKYVRVSTELTEIDCPSKEAREISVAIAFEDGSSTGSTSAVPSAWLPVPPDTGWDLAMKYLCKSK
jgi:hypothetical protein